MLDFWFALTLDQQFAKVAELDRTIGERFGRLRAEVLATEAEEWRDDPDALLAAVILLDQFSRNIGRGTARAFEGDALALDLTHAAMDRGWEERYPPDRRVFVYMPLMHTEDAVTQALSVERFIALGDPRNLAFAVEHRDVIERYGRFPSRNAALGRTSTPDEEAYLSRSDAGW